MNLYRAHGLAIRSQISLPELSPGNGAFDVTIRLASVPRTLGHASVRNEKFEVASGEFLIKTRTIARILVVEGRELVVEPLRNASPGDVRHLILGWGLGALLHQRKVLLLHAAGVCDENQCFLFCAGSGQGKSTIAATLVLRGYQLLDDNLVAVRRGLAFPGKPEVQLHPSVVSRLPRLERRPALEKRGKLAVEFKDSFCSGPRPVGSVFLIEPGSRWSFSSVHGTERFFALSGQVFRRPFAEALGNRKSRFDSLLNLSRRVSVTRVEVPHQDGFAEELADRLEEGQANKNGRSIGDQKS